MSVFRDVGGVPLLHRRGFRRPGASDPSARGRGAAERGEEDTPQPLALEPPQSALSQKTALGGLRWRMGYRPSPAQSRTLLTCVNPLPSPSPEVVHELLTYRISYDLFFD